MLYFEPFAGTLDDWGRTLETLPDRDVFQTPAWMRFIAETQRASPVIAVLKDNRDTMGYFAGLTARKFGLKILGSPFIGWTTEHMGVRLLRDVPKREVAEALTRFAFQQLKCVHVEFCDRNFGRDDLDGAGFQCRIAPGYVVDLVPDEDQLFRNMRSKSARYAIRKATKLGVVVEEARDEGFADDYHAQLVDVFANQGLIPTYGKERVRLLMRHLLPTGNLLLLRARSPEGRCIATGIFLGMNQCAYFWGNASWRQDRHFCPNEPLHWYAMCHWMRRGLRYYDMCGGGVYKRKYGGRPVETCYFRKSRFRWIAAARNVAGQAYRLYQRAALLPRRIRSTEKDNQGLIEDGGVD